MTFTPEQENIAHTLTDIRSVIDAVRFNIERLTEIVNRLDLRVKKLEERFDREVKNEKLREVDEKFKRNKEAKDD